jgi:hypothetical protein
MAGNRFACDTHYGGLRVIPGKPRCQASIGGIPWKVCMGVVREAGWDL